MNRNYYRGNRGRTVSCERDSYKNHSRQQSVDKKRNQQYSRFDKREYRDRSLSKDNHNRESDSNTKDKYEYRNNSRERYSRSRTPERYRYVKIV